jgi:hypothetical protein
MGIANGVYPARELTLTRKHPDPAREMLWSQELFYVPLGYTIQFGKHAFCVPLRGNQLLGVRKGSDRLSGIPGFPEAPQEGMAGWEAYSTRRVLTCGLSDLSRARMAGMVGTVLGFLLVYAIWTLAVVTGTSLDYGVVAPLTGVPSLILVGYAIWVLSKLAASPRVFWFYLVGVIIPLAADLLFWSGSFTVGLYGAYLIGDVLIYVSYTWIARTLGYGLFHTAALWTLVAGVIEVAAALLSAGFDFGVAIVFIAAGVLGFGSIVLGLGSIVLQVAAFNSLAAKVQSQPPAATAFSSA